MKFINKIKFNKGYITVEAAIIFPVILLCIFTVIYMGLLLYQQVYIQSLADKAAEMGAMTWSNRQKDFITGTVTQGNLDKDGPYWRLIDEKKIYKEERITKYVKDNIDKYAVLKGENTLSLNMDDYIVYKKLKVDLRNEQELPIGNLLRIFGLDNKFTITAHSETVINEPVEFIRNTDFVIDIGRELEKKNPAFAKISQSVKGVIQKMQEGLDKFFK